MAKAKFNLHKEMSLKESLFKENFKDMEFLNLRHISIKVILKMDNTTAQESIHGVQEILMKETMKKD